MQNHRLPRAFDGGALVIDPAVPAADRHALEAAAAAHRAPSPRIGYGSEVQPYGTPGAGQALAPAGTLFPFKQQRLPRAPEPPRVMSAAARRGRNAAIWTAASLAGALIAAAAGSSPLAIILLIVTAIPTAVGAQALRAAMISGWTTPVNELRQAGHQYGSINWYARYAGVRYHRCYVAPATDIDEEDQPIWARATAADTAIRGSEVVRRNFVEPGQLMVVLPQRLWEIAERLARLSEIRQHQRDSLRYAEADDSMISGQLAHQKQEIARILGNIEKRTARLEEVAHLIARADAAKRKEAALGGLAQVNDLILELRASSEDLPGDLDATERLRIEVQAVIEQASEAARDLALPDEDPDQDEGESAS